MIRKHVCTFQKSGPVKLSSATCPGLGHRDSSLSRETDFPFLGHIVQLLQGNTEAFLGQLRDIVPPSCGGSTAGPAPSGMSPECHQGGIQGAS